MKLTRVHGWEWLAALLGVLVLVGLLLPWSDGSSALDQPGLLDILLLLSAVAGILLPVVVASSPRPSVPVVCETSAWTVTLILAFVLLIKAILPPDAGFDSGFWVVFVGMAAMAFALWRGLSRQD